MNENPIRWFEIYVEDMDRARKFYETVLERKLDKLGTPDADLEMWAFPMERGAPGAAGSLAKMKGVKAGGSSVLIYFGCEDCAVEESRVTRAGGKVHRPKMSIGQYGFISLVHDTEGNLIGLHSMK